MLTYYCVRVYNNGSAVATVRDEAGMQSWLSYNQRFRPGCALFIDGICRETGYLDNDQMMQVARELVIRGTPDWPPDEIADRVEYSGPARAMSWAYKGYPAERDIPPFKWEEAA